MTGPNDRAVWAVAVGLLACIALVGGLIVEGRRDDPRRAQSTQFFAVALA